MRPLVLLAAAWLVATAAAAQPARYAEVELAAPSREALAQGLARAGVALDHAVPTRSAEGAAALRTVLRADEVEAVRAAGVAVTVRVADAAADYRARRDAARGGCPSTPYPITGSMGCYPTFAQAVAILDEMRAAYPALVASRVSLGTTGEGRAVWMVEIGDNPGADEGEPEVLFTALHHAREPQSMATVLHTVWSLLDGYGTDPEATYLLQNRRLFVVPVLNPDGYVYNETTDPDGGGFWRKNRRVNGSGSFGVDLNRNYGLTWAYDDVGSSPNPGSDTYRGPAAFSEPETSAIRDFVEGGRRVTVALNYHAYGNLLIYPWGYEADLYTPDSAAFVDYSREMVRENQYLAGTGNQTVGYLTNGDSDDWHYGEQTTKPKTFAWTPEVGERFWPTPDQILPIAEENVGMNRYALWIAGARPQAGIVTVTDGGGPSGNTYPDPGETAQVTVSLQNVGLEALAGAEVRLASTNADFTISGTFAPVATLAPGAFVALGPFAVGVAPGAPLGLRDGLVLEVRMGGLTIPFSLGPVRIGTPETLYATDASTLAGWTASGGWGVTSSVFVTPPGAFADSPTGPYSNNTNRTLTLATPVAIPAGASASLSYWVRWDTELDYDAGSVEASTNGTTWTRLAGRYTTPATGSSQGTGPVYQGTQTSWQLEDVNLAAYAGQSVRLRFRLVSDGSQTGDGMFVDDVALYRLVNGGAVAGEPAPPAAVPGLGLPAPNPASGTVALTLTLPASADVDVAVFDALGRRVATLARGARTAGAHPLAWDATAAAPGVYTVRLASGATVQSRRVLVAR